MSQLNKKKPANPEMQENKKRRYHTKSYKLKILDEIENCTVPGGVGAILRREGLYSSTISGWRKQKAAGRLDNSSEKSTDKIYDLEKENRKLKQELEQARLIIDIQKNFKSHREKGIVLNQECIAMIDNLSKYMSINKICEEIGIPKSSYYYWKKKTRENEIKQKKSDYVPSWALPIEEKDMILSILNSENYFDKSPNQIYYSLLDNGVYLCSIRTMYRILKENNQSQERRRVTHHEQYKKPELLAQNPNEVWSWDITKLKGYAKWTYYYLYVIIDIFSRYIVGWHVAYREESHIAKELIYQSLLKQEIGRDQLTIHADRGASMRSKPVAFLLSDLGVIKSHSRPYQSNDNPYSEAQFKTLKYSPTFPDRFESIESAQEFCREFFTWYNKEHYHSGIGYYTPESVHFEYCYETYNDRTEVLLEAYNSNPERFRNKKPRPHKPPKEAWINKPKKELIESIC